MTTAIIDNWIQDQSEISEKLQQIISRELEELHESSPGPGYVNQVGLIRHIKDSSERYFELRHSHREVVKDISTISCQGIKFHIDDCGSSLLWILHNDGYSVEGRNEIPKYQEPGAVILLNTHRTHRCRSVDRKTKGKYWLALCLDYKAGFKLDRERAESDLQKVIDLIKHAQSNGIV